MILFVDQRFYSRIKFGILIPSFSCTVRGSDEPLRFGMQVRASEEGILEHLKTEQVVLRSEFKNFPADAVTLRGLHFYRTDSWSSHPAFKPNHSQCQQYFSGTKSCDDMPCRVEKLRCLSAANPRELAPLWYWLEAAAKSIPCSESQLSTVEELIEAGGSAAQGLLVKFVHLYRSLRQENIDEHSGSATDSEKCLEQLLMAIQFLWNPSPAVLSLVFEFLQEADPNFHAAMKTLGSMLSNVEQGSDIHRRGKHFLESRFKIVWEKACADWQFMTMKIEQELPKFRNKSTAHQRGRIMSACAISLEDITARSRCQLLMEKRDDAEAAIRGELEDSAAITVTQNVLKRHSYEITSVLQAMANAKLGIPRVLQNVLGENHTHPIVDLLLKELQAWPHPEVESILLGAWTRIRVPIHDSPYNEHVAAINSTHVLHGTKVLNALNELCKRKLTKRGDNGKACEDCGVLEPRCAEETAVITMREISRHLDQDWTVSRCRSRWR